MGKFSKVSKAWIPKPTPKIYAPAYPSSEGGNWAMAREVEKTLCSPAKVIASWPHAQWLT